MKINDTKQYKTSEERRAYQKQWRDKRPDYQRQYYIDWYAKHGRKRPKNYQEQKLKWIQLFPHKYQIQLQLRRAIQKGMVIRPKFCSRCGRETKIQAHHFNYDNFMNFIWLCASCHKKEHPNDDFT